MRMRWQPQPATVRASDPLGLSALEKSYVLFPTLRLFARGKDFA